VTKAAATRSSSDKGSNKQLAVTTATTATR